MKKQLLILFILAISTSTVFAQLTFQKTYGAGHEVCNQMEKTSDGGFIFVGIANAFCFGLGDVYLVKIDSIGNLLWTKTYAVGDFENGWAVIQNKEGGYAIAGAIQSTGVQPAYYFVKTDNNGNLLNSKTYGNYASAYPNVIRQMSDSGYAIYGYCYDYNFQSLLVRTKKNGDPLWSKTYLGQIGKSLVKTNDDGFILCGQATQSYLDIYVTKTDNLGNTIWTQLIGLDSAYATCSQIKQTLDGGYIIVGSSQVSNVQDLLLLKIDSLANVQWAKTYGGVDLDVGNDVEQTSDGGYIVTGITCSFGDSIGDAYLLKTDSVGNLLWSKTYGDTGKDQGCSVKQTNDGGFLVAGGTWISGGVYLIKTDTNGNAGCYEGNPATIVKNQKTHYDSSTFIIGQCNAFSNPLTFVGDTGGVNILCISSGIFETNNPSPVISIYPNPAIGILTVETFRNVSIEIYNIQGQTIKRLTVKDKKTDIDISDIARGIYLVKATSDKGMTTRKFLKE
jgi:hypothetical protein